MIIIIDGKRFGIPLKAVKRVLHAKSLDVYPVQINLPSLYGYCKFDGTFLPLINLRILFQLLTTEVTLESSVLVVDTGLTLVGFLCDSTQSVVMPETELITLPTPLLVEAYDFFSGVFLHFNDMIVLINPETIFRKGDLTLMIETGEKVKKNLEALAQPSQISEEQY